MVRFLASSILGFAVITSPGCKTADPADPHPDDCHCHHHVAPKDPDGFQVIAEHEHEQGPFLVRWKSDPDPLPFNDLFSVDLEILEREGGGPADGVQVRIDATMPEHAHGMNVRPEVQQVEPGRWRVDGMMFHMGGRWVLHVKLYRDHEYTDIDFEIILE